MLRDRQTCRLCGQRDFADELFRYGVRQYAHFECFKQHKTIADLDRLPEAWRRQFEEWFKEIRSRPDGSVR
jgi:hypothetical protein